MIAAESVLGRLRAIDDPAVAGVDDGPPVVVAVVSDLHAGSTHGLCPAEGVELERGARWLPGPGGEERWAWWLDYWRRVAGWREQVGGRLVGLFNGDLTDGNVFRHQELIDQPSGTQVRLVLSCLEPYLALAPERTFVARGTPVHVGPQADLEQAVGRAVGADKDPRTRTYAAYSWLLDIHGKRVLATHHPPSRGRLVRTRKSQLSLTANEVASRYMERKDEDGRPCRPPDIAIFAHGHEPDDSGPVLPHRVGTRAILLGAWQSKTQYAEKVAPVATEQCHGLILTFWPDGRQEHVEHVCYPQQFSPPVVSL